MRLPDDVREAALQFAYAVFDHRRWEQVPAGERSAVYDELVANPACGGLLRPYMTEGQTRVWLKDSAAKEYPRALEGIGSTARFTPRRYPGPDAIVQSALGLEWRVVGGSIEQKPMRCEARGPHGESVTLIWGSLRGLRDLFWAAAQARGTGNARVAIAITRPSMKPLPADEWAKAQTLCHLIGADIYSVMYTPRAIFS